MALRAAFGLFSILSLCILSSATAQTTSAIRDRLDALVRSEAAGWFFNQYNSGSMRNVTIDFSHSSGQTAEIRGDYTFNGSAQGWVVARITDGQFSCIEYWDTSGACRSPRRSSDAANALAEAVIAFAASGNAVLPPEAPPTPQLAAPLGGAGLPRSLREAIRDHADDFYTAAPDGSISKLRIFSTQPDLAEVECIIERAAGPAAHLVRVGDQTCRGTIDLRTGIFEQRVKTGTADGCVDWPVHTDRILGADGPPPWKQAAAMDYCQQYYIEYAPSCGRINCGAWASAGKQWRSQIFVGREAALAFAGN